MKKQSITHRRDLSRISVINVCRCVCVGGGIYEWLKSVWCLAERLLSIYGFSAVSQLEGVLGLNRSLFDSCIKLVACLCVCVFFCCVFVYLCVCLSLYWFVCLSYYQYMTLSSS
jgi:hypothetical protein